MKKINCPICAGSIHIPLYTVRDYNMHVDGEFHLVRCNGCNLIFLNPAPEEAELRGFYPTEKYFSKRDGRLRRKMEIFKRYAGGIKGRALDVGCGYPLFLNELKKYGWEVRGVDFSEKAAVWAEDDFNIALETGAISAASYPEEYFDAVTFWHSLEHVPDPAGVLLKFSKFLKKGGIFILCVPNVGSFQARLFRGMWYHLDAPRHLCHFSKAALNMISDKTGLCIKDTDCRFFVDTFYGWMFSALNLFNLNSPTRDMRWLIALPIKIMLVVPVLILSLFEEFFNKGASITLVLVKTV